MIARATVLLEATSPIAHGDTHSGIGNETNARLFMRNAVAVRGMAMPVPGISGNAMRTTMLRVPLADHLVESARFPCPDLSRLRIKTQ
jgi:hypothetical protein